MTADRVHTGLPKDGERCTDPNCPRDCLTADIDRCVCGLLLHGHCMRCWACLQEDGDDGPLRAPGIEEVAALSDELLMTEIAIERVPKSVLTAEVSKRLATLRAEVERLKEEAAIRDTKTACAYCGQEYPLDDKAATAVSEHIRTCEKHPLFDTMREVRRLEAENAALNAALDFLKAAHNPDRPRVDIVDDLDGKPYEEYTLKELLDESDIGDLVTQYWLENCYCGACKEVMRRLGEHATLKAQVEAVRAWAQDRDIDTTASLLSAIRGAARDAAKGAVIGTPSDPTKKGQ